MLAAPLSLSWLSGCDAHPSAAAGAHITDSKPAAPSTPAPEPLPSSEPVAPSDSRHPFVTSGPLVADRQADIAADRDGRVVSIAVDIGDRVQASQLLASFDDRILRATLDTQIAHLASLRAQVVEWQAEQKMDEADLRRADQMRSEKITTQESWEHVKYKLDEVIAEVTRYQADEKAAESDLTSARLQLQQSQIVAPFAGIVGRRSVRLAQEVKRGDVLFWITGETPLHVLFTVPESMMSKFRVGAPLDLTTLDFPSLHQSARVSRVSPVVDPASGSIQVIGTLTHPSPLLKAGMSMQIELGARDLLPR